MMNIFTPFPIFRLSLRQKCIFPRVITLLIHAKQDIAVQKFWPWWSNDGGCNLSFWETAEGLLLCDFADMCVTKFYLAFVTVTT